MKIIKYLIVFVLILILVYYFTLKEIRIYRVNPYVGFTEGQSADWAYGDQIKEFSSDKPFYAEIKVDAIACKKKFIGKKVNVYSDIKYENCDIELSDGHYYWQTKKKGRVKHLFKVVAIDEEFAEQIVDRQEGNVFIYKITPKGKGKIEITVKFDGLKVINNIPIRKTVYFNEDSDSNDDLVVYR